MQRLPRWRPWIALLAGIWGVAAAGFFSPERFTDPLRSAVVDALGPGRRAAIAVSEQSARVINRFRAPEANSDLAAAQAEIAVLQARNREQAAMNLTAIQQVSASELVGPPLPSARDYEPLLAAGLVPARILGRDPDVLKHRFGRILGRGSSSAIAVDDLVLANLPHLDQGADAGIEAGQPAISGRVVVGCIVQAGRWTSALQLVTDPDYRGFAQLVRQSRGRTLLGPTGVLVGAGKEGCRLELVPKEQPVSIGDYVYSRQQDADQPAPVYYGRVIDAQPGDEYWTVTVEPAFDPAQLRDVQVLNISLNPQRIAEDQPTPEAAVPPAASDPSTLDPRP